MGKQLSQSSLAFIKFNKQVVTDGADIVAVGVSHRFIVIKNKFPKGKMQDLITFTPLKSNTIYGQ